MLWYSDSQVALRRQQAQEECEARELGLLYSSAVHNNSGNGSGGATGGGGGGRIPHANSRAGLFDDISSPTSDINKADYQSSPTGKWWFPYSSGGRLCAQKIVYLANKDPRRSAATVYLIIRSSLTTSGHGPLSPSLLPLASLAIEMNTLLALCIERSLLNDI